MQLSVIIVNYNVKYFLEQCLYSVESACKNLEAEIIVVDNASSDADIEYLQPKFSKVKFIRNDVNFGFAKANNEALSIANGKFILYLNPDTILAENTIVDCITFLEQHTEAGAVGIKMIDGSGNFLPESKRAFPSVTASFGKLSGMASVFPKSGFFNRYALGNLDENDVHEADVLLGAFFMSRKNILLELKGFDEDFFMYGEDIDLSYRIQKSGYKNYYLGNNTIIHFKGESTQKENPGYVKNFYTAMKIFVDKHYKKHSSFFLKPAISLSAALSSLKHRTSSNKKEKKNLSFILVGDDEDIQSAKNILSKLNYPFQIINSLPQLNQTSNLKPALPAGRLPRLNDPVGQEASRLIFCMGKLTYAETISFIEKNKNKFSYHWHKSNSQSVVGSDSSNTTGQILIAV
jgi:N-acetylglucosaminyl-diphospho-decaprenol L-rhamnosyltransferase